MDNAFEGFRLGRHKPMTIVVWAVYFTFASAVTAILSVTLIGPAMGEFMAMGATASPEEAQATLATLARVWPASLLVSLWSVVVWGVAQTAATRAVLRPQDDRFAYLRFGLDEVRVCVALIGYWALLLGVYLGGVVVAAILAAIGAMAGPVGAALMVVVCVCALVAALLVVGVRLSLAPAMTLETGKITVLASWERTRGRFWPMLGAYFVSWVLALLVTLLVMVIYVALATLVTGNLTGAAAGISDAKAMSSLQVYFTPLRLIYLPFGGVSQALVAGIAATVPAAIFAQIRGPRASVFD